MQITESVLDRYNRIAEEITGGDIGKLRGDAMKQVAVMALREIHGADRDFSAEEIAGIETQFFMELAESIEEDAENGDPEAQKIEEVVGSIMEELDKADDD